MNQIDIGNFIARKRKEKNLTQADPAEKKVYPTHLFAVCHTILSADS
ncbi:MAG: hypothetical protein IJM37_10605 [Lachnospiraceae bacterium]|nr:hypothetical protein [Lachnospiraceae bacterium]